MVGEGPLGLFDLPLEFTHGPEVRGNVCAGLLLVRLDEIVDDTVVEIFTTEMSVTGSSQHLEDTVVDGEKGDIESSTTEIVDDDLGFATLLVETVGDGGSGRLVDDTEDLETSNGAGVLGSLTLSVVKVYKISDMANKNEMLLTGRNSDHGVGDLFTKVGLGSLLHFGQDHGGNLFGCKVAGLALVLDRDGGFAVLLLDLKGPVLHVALDILVVHLAPNETLGVKDRVTRVGVEGVLGRVTDKAFVIGEGDPGGCDTVTLVVGNDFYTSTARYTTKRLATREASKDEHTQHKSKWFQDLRQVSMDSNKKEKRCSPIPMTVPYSLVASSALTEQRRAKNANKAKERQDAILLVADMLEVKYSADPWPNPALYNGA